MPQIVVFFLRSAPFGRASKKKPQDAAFQFEIWCDARWRTLGHLRRLKKEKACFFFLLGSLVPATGLEPARLAAYAPKAYVYTNFTTRAYLYIIAHFSEKV